MEFGGSCHGHITWVAMLPVNAPAVLIGPVLSVGVDCLRMGTVVVKHCTNG